MASHRIGETGLSESGASSHHHNIPYAVFHEINNPSSTSFTNQEGSAFDFGELEQAIGLKGVKIGNTNNNNDEAQASLFSSNTGRPAATLEMFPSWPMRYHHTPRESSKSGGESTDSGSAMNNNNNTVVSLSSMEPESSLTKKPSISSSSFDNQTQMPILNHTTADSSVSPSKQPQDKRKGPGSTSDKQLDSKTLRRLAQNREAARKSRLRKKAYVQQLESSRIKLTQIEQELQRARSQGLFVGGGGGGSMSSGAAIFDMEYGRWVEEEQRHTSELRSGLQSHMPDSDLRAMVDSYISHYDEMFRLKGAAAKADVFHVMTGMWTSPAERCFLWMGGFRPSDLIKMVIPQLDPLTEQQLMGIYNLQHSSQQAEEALSQGLDQLQQSLVDTIAGGALLLDAMHQMALALGKLSNLEGFVRQADNLRQQTLHQLRRTLTIRQAARCFLVIAEYYGRLRALSSLWASRPREHQNMVSSDEMSCQITTDLQMVHHHQHHQPHHHFTPF